MKSIVCTNERADQHCAESTRSNLVMVRSPPDETSLAQTLILKAPSRNQRYPSTVRGCFDGVAMSDRAMHPLVVRSDIYKRKSVINYIVHGFGAVVNPANTFRASSTRRCFPQFDRKTDCYRNGVLELSGGFIFSLIRLSHINAVNHSSNMLCHIQSYFPQKLCQTDEKPGIFIGPNHPIKGKLRTMKQGDYL